MSNFKKINETSISVNDVCQNEGFDNDLEMLQHYMLEGVVPACCSEGCQVEPDGTCEHGNQSILLSLGLI